MTSRLPAYPDDYRGAMATIRQLEASNKALQEKLAATERHVSDLQLNAQSNEEASYAQVARLVDERDVGKATIESLNLRVARLVEALRKSEPAQVTKDWACVECHPESDCIVDGFKCWYHSALSASDQDNQQWLHR